MAQRAAELLVQTHAGAGSPSGLSARGFSAPSRAIALDLPPLIAPYRRYGRFTLRIENLPQGARLTAGRNNGDRTWSLALDELDDLFYVPPESLADDYTLSVRLIAREEGNASTLALIELPIRADKMIASPPPAFGHRKLETPQPEQGDALKQQISSLRAELAGREQELDQIRTASQSLNGDWQARLETAIAAAKNEWSGAEASSLAKADHAKELTALYTLEDHVAQANNLLAERERELAALKAELTEQRRKSETEISAARKALETQSAQDAQRREQSARAIEELKARCDEAESSLLCQRQKSEVEIAAAKQAIAARGALELDQQEHARAALAELQGRCDEAEAKFSHQRQVLEAEVMAARNEAEEQDAAEAARENEAAQALVELQARCEVAEAALRSAQATRERTVEDDAYVRGLNQEIKNLQAILVDREAAIARAEASLEQMQVGVVAKPPPTHWEPLPGSFRPSSDDAPKPNSHLLRDFILVFGLVMVACLAYFLGPSLLSANWQVPDLANLFAANDGDPDMPAPTASASVPLPKLQPQAMVVRSVNLRATPSTSAQVVASLKQGAVVMILDRHGSWDHVEVVISGQISRQGWVYGRYVGDTNKNPAVKP